MFEPASSGVCVRSKSRSRDERGLIQERDDDGTVHSGGSSAGGTSAFWYNVKVDPVGVADGLDAEGEGKRGVKDDSRIWA